MSYDVYVFDPAEGAPDDRGEVFNVRYPGDTSGMVFAAALGRSLGSLHGVSCAEAADVLKIGIERIHDDRAEEFLRLVSAAVAEHPDGWIEVQW